jgi:hypothetical protein
MPKEPCTCGSNHAADQVLQYFHPSHECQNHGTEKLVRADGQYGIRMICPPCAVHLVDETRKFVRV